MAKNLKVERPTKKSEFEIRFASAQAQRGWMNLKATIRGPLGRCLGFSDEDTSGCYTDQLSLAW